MLTRLTVRHLAVIEDIEVCFANGMTSLTGETGAGKSILVDALGLALGDRADSNMVRQGCERAEVTASFDITNNLALQHWLSDHELDDDELCQLRRTISKEGRSRAYINGRVVPLNQLRAISTLSVDIHGQHAHQSLLRSETQRQLLDTVAGTQALLTELAAQYQQLQASRQQLTQLQQQASEQSARRQLLEYQVNELAEFNLTTEYLTQLIQEQQYLANASQLITSAQSAQQQLFDQEQGSAYSVLNEVLSELSTYHEIEPRFQAIITSLNSNILELDEVSKALRHYLDHNEIDPQRLQQLEAELSKLHDLARKHHIEIEQLPTHFASLQQELATLTTIEADSEALQQQQQDLLTKCRTLCNKISQQRQQAAVPLASQITESIQQLAIPTGKIEFAINTLDNGDFNETGADHIQLLVATNPGQTPAALAKVASGGELSRISLAIQVATADHRSVPTLVFDEVDVGIGGSTAEIVGKHLHKLASHHQVICITHLAQVAAQAQQQLQITKSNLTEKAYITICQLDKTERVAEIARMLGGVTITEKTRLHAEEMLQRSSQH